MLDRVEVSGAGELEGAELRCHVAREMPIEIGRARSSLEVRTHIVVAREEEVVRYP